MEPAATGMSLILGYVTDFVTSAISWMGQVFTFIVAPGHELALIAFIAVWAGLAIHWFKLLTRG